MFSKENTPMSATRSTPSVPIRSCQPIASAALIVVRLMTSAKGMPRCNMRVITVGMSYAGPSQVPLWQIAADRIGPKAGSTCELGHGPGERAGTMPNIKQHTVFAGTNDRGLQLARGWIDDAIGATMIRMGIKIASYHFAWAVLHRYGGEIVMHHQRQLNLLGRRQCSFVGFVFVAALIGNRIETDES